MKTHCILLFVILFLPNMLLAQERSIGFNGLNLIKGNDATISFRNWKDATHTFRTDFGLQYNNDVTILTDNLTGVISNDKKVVRLNSGVGVTFSKESLKQIYQHWSYFLNPVYGINSSYSIYQNVSVTSSWVDISKNKNLEVGLSGGLRLGVFRKLGEKFSISVESQVTISAGYIQNISQRRLYQLEQASGSYQIQTSNEVKTNKTGFYTSLNNQYLLSAVLSFHYPKKH